ncbi:MAG: DUF3380 domain-containing protein [Mesorhizobium sp.]|uniref:N-acetylmuramidase domain-containing protein n=1 Tax=Mesorhizobium sp. TaxID=1871066 RepID=UPI000FE9205A|nr:N-acetylmuramidase domain-containing protein [Mesorhizobium sp.]RWP44281.1 MAG: DUF3380 domain-containing protein [Mesorhizobium sp.]
MKPSATFAIGRNTTSLTFVDYQRIAGTYNLQAAHVQTVVQVEAGTAGFWNDHNMKLLYEGHIAYRETSGAVRQKLVAAGLAWKSWGDVPYGKATVSRDRLRAAVEIAGDQAYRWASYGLGQVMGFNAEVCGYSSAKAMFDAFLDGEPSQVDGMMRFIKGTKLLDALRACNWKVFARGYNGSGYAKNKYDTKLASAFAKFRGGAPVADPWADGVLTIGDKGAVVEELQKILGGMEIDGSFGRATAQAVAAFQKAHGLKVDGIVGPKTWGIMKSAGVVAPAPAPVSTADRKGLLDIILAIFKAFTGK